MLVGQTVGVEVGDTIGDTVGIPVGDSVGEYDGAYVGSHEYGQFVRALPPILELHWCPLLSAHCCSLFGVVPHVVNGTNPYTLLS